MRCCVVCYREARGFGVFDPQYHFTDVERIKRARVFCSRQCMEIFNRFLKTNEGKVMNNTETEKRALQAVLKPLGETVADIGMNKPLALYSMTEIERLVEVVVNSYQSFMSQEESYTKNRELPF
jgi:hypothetical protein